MYANQNLKLIECLSILLTSQKMQMNIVFQIIQKINNSKQQSRKCITILQQIFNKECSNKILFTVELLEYLVKNSNTNFHQAANIQSFQKSLLRLLRRQRGKFSLVEKLRSNLENWAKIQAKTLYIIQLWYDTFILQQANYYYIINNYKILRKEGIIFPPRKQEEKNMMFVKTQSPIFDHISEIAMSDREKLKKRKIALGIQNFQENNVQKKSMKSKISLINQFEQKPLKENTTKTFQYINLDDVQNLIAIIRSLDHQTQFTNQSYQKLKYMIQNYRKPNNPDPLYNQIIRQAQKVILEWQNKLKENVIHSQEEYMKRKLKNLNVNEKQQAHENYEEVEEVQQKVQVKIPQKQIDLLDL